MRAVEIELLTKADSFGPEAICIRCRQRFTPSDPAFLAEAFARKLPCERWCDCGGLGISITAGA